MDLKDPSDSELMEYLRKKYLAELRVSHSPHKSYLASKYEEPLELKPEEFFEYMDSKGISDKCTSCGSEDVVIPIGTYTELDESTDADSAELEQKRIKYASFTFLTDSSGEPTPARPYYIRHCAECGHLDLFRAKNVLEWVREHRKQSGEGEGNEPT